MQQPPTTPPSAPERDRLRQLFSRIATLEAGCDAGTHVRSFVATPNGVPAGFAWLPPELPAVPRLDHTRVVEMRGPRGESLLFVPLAELPAVLRQAAADRGVEAWDLSPLASLAPDSPDIAVNGVLALIHRLARLAPGTPGT